MSLRDTGQRKIFSSPDYNFIFYKDNGMFLRWGKNVEDDPQFSPFGPEILDLEISSGGDCLGHCKFCYKSNGGNQPTKNMSFDTFKTIIDKMPKTLTQIAFGIMNMHTNRDFFKMMEYARKNGIIPNYTTHGLDVTSISAKLTAKYCGAVAVSVYKKEKAYRAIEMFTNQGMKQVNIHHVLAEETFHKALDIIDDIKSDLRLRSVNAIVFLQYKPKGRNPNVFTPISEYNLIDIIDYAKMRGVSIGFDSCTAHKVLKILPEQQEFIEPCESFLFSSYCNVDGEFFPCSFTEGEKGWETGLNAINGNFLKDIWLNAKMKKWRTKLLENKRKCPVFRLDGD